MSSLLEKPIVKKISSLIRQWDGKLTRDLLLSPGKFGLGKVPDRLKPDATTNMVCGFCSTGCSLKVHLKEGQAINVSPTTEYPVNLGMACPKGWEALTPLKSKDRATTPYLRNSKGQLEAVSWDKALKTFTTKFKEIQEKYGEDSLAFISTGQIPFEEMAYLGALSKFGLKIKHGDGNTRQCMATAVVSYKQSFGFDAPPYTYKDFEESDVIVFVGANPCIAHPIMWERVMLNKNNPSVIVVDPRKTETAMYAKHHYDINPKSDTYFFYGLAKLLIDMDALDKDFLAQSTNGFEDFKEFLNTITLDEVVEQSGISLERLTKLAEIIKGGKRVSFWWTMGVNQSHEGVRAAQAIINIALMTGNIGKPGTGANSITGQCNAMGSRLFSNTTGLLGGHDFLNADHRQKVADALEIDVKEIPDQNCWAYDQIVEGISSNKIKGLWVIATNSSHSWINQSNFNNILQNLDFLVVQDMYHTTETAENADLVLPAAAWGEKEGCFINSERRIGRIKKISKSPGQALPDFEIFKLISHYWGVADMFKKWDTPESVFKLLAGLTKGQPCDITAIPDYDYVDKQGGVQWPLKSLDDISETNERRLFADGKFYHPDGKAKFLFEAPRKVGEPTDENYPFTLLTGRGTSAQWHTQTRTGKSEVLKKLYPQYIYVEINPKAAKEIGIKNNEWIYVYSRRGKIKVKSFVTTNVKEDHLFISMHYKDTNKLTFPSFDPYSRQPSYKHCAVNIEKISYWDEE